MSQQFHPVSQEQNVFVRYQKIPQEEEKKNRSGILEHYTYKTDNGEVLKRPIIHTTKNYNSGIMPINCKPQDSSAETTRNKMPKPIRTYVNMHRIHASVPPNAAKSGNSSKKIDDEKVRMEHCDSTTDILENFDINTSCLFASPNKRQHSDDDNAQKNNWKPSQRSKMDSDSDCEIVDVSDSHVGKSKTRCTTNDTCNTDKQVMTLVNLNKDIENLKTKVLDWISIKPSRKSQPVIHIISDESDGDHDNHDDDDETVEYLCEKTGLKSKKPIEKTVTHDCRNTVKMNEPEKSNISIILQKKDHAGKHQTNTKENMFKSDAKQTIIIQKKDPLQLMNEKLYRIKTKLSREFKSPMISATSNANCIKLPPKPCSNILDKTLCPNVSTNENELTAQKSPKMCAPLSPESIKSEFYSYLKINTNPSAQKAEIIAQNRRSTRVKNLILQIERNKEQKSLKIKNNEKKEERANEIRKKFMKYSKPNVVFPRPPPNCYKFADFEPVIEAFIYKEKNASKVQESFNTSKETNTDKTRKYKLRKRRYNKKHLERKYIQNKINLQNRILKKKRRKQIVTKMIGCTPQISDIQLRRLRFRPNRIYRDPGKITRSSLNSFKVPRKGRKLRKSKLNGNINLNEKKEVDKNKSKVNLESDVSVNVRDVKTLSTEKPKQIESDNKVNEKKLTITEAKSNPIELKLQQPEPKLTIREVVVNKQEETNKKESNIKITDTNKSISNKITITEVKILPVNLDDKNVNVDVSTSNNLVRQIGAVSPNNILLPNLLASKLSLALKKNLPATQTNKYKKRIFALNSFKTDESYNSNNYFLGFKKNEIIESNKNRSLSPVCYGFEPDEKTAKICKIMQEVVSNLDTDILVTSNSPIQTPEPIEHLVPEIHINSIPISNEPCNLQEVMSIMSSGLTNSQDLTPMLQNEDTSSDYSEASSAQEELQLEVALGELIDPALIEKSTSNVIPLNQNIKTKSFHRSLMQTRVKQKPFLDVYRSNVFEQSDSDSSMATPKGSSNKNSLTHGIDINSKGGAMFTTHYINGILIIVQEFMITFWKQTALGNILGAQNMWLPNGSLQRIILERGCINRRSSEMVLSCDSSVAYIELWTKQHESKFRECPIADVFATIYFHRGHGIPDKKVLQLENIKG